MTHTDPRLGEIHVNTVRFARAAAIAWAVLFFLAAHARAEAAAFRILYAEPVMVTTSDASADTALSKPSGATTLALEAYGRHFDLELEPNTRLVNALEAPQRRALERYAIYRGRISGLPGSWVRLVRSGKELTGAIWDGNDLYSISSARSVAEFLDAPLNAAADALVVYRLSDTVSDGRGTACMVRTLDGEAKTSQGPLADYSKLIAELQASSAQLADRQIEIAFLGDAEFISRHAPDPQAAAITRINIVDGIYAEQVGVMIAAPVIRLVPAGPSNPFLTTSAFELLDQVSQYRLANPDVRDRGLAHLFTGKNLAENIAGVAFLGALCDPQGGVGLGESLHPDLLSAVIAAHEIGHNFNAPHDGEEASPCESTSQSFIMAPTINTASAFSRCSLNQMYYEMEGAACITPANTPDARMGTEGLITAPLGQPFDVPFDVASVGTADIASVSAIIPLPADLAFVSANVAGGTCSSSGLDVRCELGALPIGTSRSGAVRLTAQATGTRTIVMRADASGDPRSANDTDTVRIDIGSGADLSIGVSPARVEAFTGQSVDVTVTVASTGTSTVDGAFALISVGTELVLENLQAPGVTCTAPPSMNCTIGTMAPGETRRIDLRVRSDVAGIFANTVHVLSSNDGNPGNNSGSMLQVFESAADAMVESNVPNSDRATGESFDVVFTVSSIGPQPVGNVLARLTVPSGFVVESATGGGSACAVNGTDIQCPLGTLPSRSSRRIALRGRGTLESGPGFIARVTAINDDNPANDETRANISIRPTVDVEIFNVFPPQAFEGRPFTLNVPFSNRGLGAASDVSVTAGLPASFDILQASLNGGSCTVGGNTSVCTFASMPRNTGAHVALQIRANQTGTFTGTFSVSATDDENPGNNSLQRQFVVGADVDVSVASASVLVGAVVGMPIDIPVTVRTGLRPINSVTLTFIFNVGSGMTFDSINPQATCSAAGTTVTCSLGTLPGQSTTVFTIRARFAAEGVFPSLSQVSATGDTDNNNNTANFTLDVGGPADVAMTIAQPALTGTVGQEISAEIQLTTAGAVARNVRVEMTLPAGMTLASGLQGGCFRLEANGTCHIDNLNPGTAHRVGYNFRASSPGTQTIVMRVFATNDTNPQNDTGQFTVVATAAPPPPPPPPPPRDEGGGGGGAFGWVALALLLLLNAWSRRSRPRRGL